MKDKRNYRIQKRNPLIVLISLCALPVSVLILLYELVIPWFMQMGIPTSLIRQMDCSLKMFIM